MSPRLLRAAVSLGALAALIPSSAHAVPRCLTPWALRAIRSGEPSPSADRGGGRPESIGSIDSAAYPIRVHWRRDGDEDKAQAVLEHAETAWRVEVDEIGWPAPPDDGTSGGDGRFDFYLTNEGTYGGAYTWGTGGDAVPGDGYFSLASYVALDDSLADWDLPVFVSHEFNHACQYAVDGWEMRAFVWEATAEAMEDVVADDSDYYYFDIPDFNGLPFLSLVHDSYSDAVTDYQAFSFYEYGGCIFGHFLEQRYGDWDGRTLRDLWLGLGQPSTAAEPDFLDSAEALFAPDGDFGDVYLEFAEWRLFVASLDDGAHFEEGGQWPGRAKVAVEDTLNWNAADGAVLEPADPPYDLGTSYWEIDPGGSAEGALRFTLVGEEGTRWGLVAAAWRGDGPAEVVKDRGRGGDAVTLDLGAEGATTVMVGAANLGPADFDAEDEPERRSFTLSIEAAQAEGDDDGDDDAAGDDDTTSDGDDEGEACSGCAVPAGAGRSGRAGGPVALGAAVAGLFAARRRRSR